MAIRRSASVTAGNSSTPDGTRKHLKPSTPAATRPLNSETLPGTTPPQNPTSTKHCPSAARRLASRPATVVVAGMLLSGMSTIVVTPPAAAARVAVSKPSHSVRPGSFTWTCVSTTPGITTASPASSTGQPAGTSSKSSTPTIWPARMCTAAGRGWPSVTTRRLRTTRSGSVSLDPAGVVEVEPRRPRPQGRRDRRSRG